MILNYIMVSWLFIPKAQILSEKMNNWTSSKLKNFCTSKETIKKVIRQPNGMGKKFANHVSVKI